jgi:hypothetical protein
MWEEMLTKMPDYMISDKGVVKEWSTPLLEDSLNHRHSSHLYALYDGMTPEIERSPKLQEGFRKIVEIKLENHYKKAGFMSFGVVQLGQAATSLGEGELVYAAIVRLANSYWLGNLASMHNHRSLFNMDISGGMPAVIIKALVGSDPGRVKLLPALPRAWPKGTIEGVLCRGQIEITRLSWDGRKTQVSLKSAKRQTITLEMPAEIAEIDATKSRPSVEKTDKANARKVSVPAGQEITLDIELK